MKIYLDTNILVYNWLIDSNQSMILERYLSWTNDELCIPQVTLKEIKRKYIREFKAITTNHENISRILSAIGDSIEPLRNHLEVERLYQKSLNNRLMELKARIVELPKIKIDRVLDRDLEERKPFRKDGRGFRDALIWESILRDLDTHDEKGLLITADSDFYLKDNDSQLLHPDLLSDIKSRGFPKDRILVVNSIKEFNEKYTQELLEKVYKFGEPIEGSIIENLDSTKILERYRKYINWEIDKRLQTILSISMGLYEKVSLLSWPDNPIILEAFDLKDDLIQLTIKATSLVDANIFTNSDGYEKLIGYTKHQIDHILDNDWDGSLNKIQARIRFRLNITLGVLWNKENNDGEGAQIIEIGLHANPRST